MSQTSPRRDGRLDMSEETLEDAVRGICRDLGVVRVHHRDSRQTTSGWPDDICIGPGGILFRELKRTSGKVTATQAAMHAALTEAGADVAVWRPAQLVDGTIARQVAAISRVRDRVAPRAGDLVEVPLGDGARMQFQRLADGHVWVSVESDTDRAHVTLGPGVQRVVAEFLRGRPFLTLHSNFQ